MIQRLTDQERMTLQNIMLRIALEEEHIEKYRAYIGIANSALGVLKMQLEAWKHTFNQQLIKDGLDITRVNINTETGEIEVVDNVQTLAPMGSVNVTG